MQIRFLHIDDQNNLIMLYVDEEVNMIFVQNKFKRILNKDDRIHMLLKIKRNSYLEKMFSTKSNANIYR